MMNIFINKNGLSCKNKNTEKCLNTCFGMPDILFSSRRILFNYYVKIIAIDFVKNTINFQRTQMTEINRHLIFRELFNYKKIIILVFCPKQHLTYSTTIFLLFQNNH